MRTFHQVKGMEATQKWPGRGPETYRREKESVCLCMCVYAYLKVSGQLVKWAEKKVFTTGHEDLTTMESCDAGLLGRDLGLGIASTNVQVAYPPGNRYVAAKIRWAF